MRETPFENTILISEGSIRSLLAGEDVVIERKASNADVWITTTLKLRDKKAKA